MSANNIVVFEGGEQVANYMLVGNLWVNQDPPVKGLVAQFTLKDEMSKNEMERLAESRVFPYREGGAVDAELKRMGLSEYDAWKIFERTNGKRSGDDLEFMVREIDMEI